MYMPPRGRNLPGRLPVERHEFHLRAIVEQHAHRLGVAVLGCDDQRRLVERVPYVGTPGAELVREESLTSSAADHMNGVLPQEELS